MRTFLLNRPHKNGNKVTDPNELLREIERKDAMFRLFQTVFGVVLFGLMALLLLQSYSLQSQNNQLLRNQQGMVQENVAITKAIKDSQASSEADNKAKLTNLQNHIDCIVSLFQKPNRASLTITDITTCQLSALGGSTGSTKSG
jgi:type II secretory pathway pseudopilin PulG